MIAFTYPFSSLNGNILVTFACHFMSFLCLRKGERGTVGWE